MANSRRRDIVNFLVTELKKINGDSSTFDASYTYNFNLANNVFRQLKFIDEVNDFPALYLSAGAETRDYQTQGFTLANLPIVIRCYIKQEEAQDGLENLIDDVEHVIYNISSQSDKGILQFNISNISTDEGLIEPYGLGEVFIDIGYEIED